MARRGAGADGCLMNRIWGNSRWHLGTRAPGRPVRVSCVPDLLAHVAIDVSADKDLRNKVAWNPSQSRTPRVIPSFPQASEPAIYLTNDCDDPAVLFRRRLDLAWPATPGRIPDADMDGRRGFERRASPVQQATRRVQQSCELISSAQNAVEEDSA
ncbi:uncharacterized protein TrAtP1_006787 [Trichoderma atroviride]|uniref:Uncharacterized protein n=1 Tax=Hypocrea atroviridis (strain ATCC 20476 / IMI 206040) TaxID=452589 RepID=G9PBF3_HYPAI|nr:uncharacterized protein TRIATDRAFT_313732 [Trichoderma atroviride IMI 206040]EHK39700.1 hypothetical protein TRIATDRAFT_313732 [Trichoderma atroviride IMI 206040]UKZ65590.1 hypothetical protein TrAtP1_006787 [Trichoderma atroviride]